MFKYYTIVIHAEIKSVMLDPHFTCKGQYQNTKPEMYIYLIAGFVSWKTKWYMRGIFAHWNIFRFMAILLILAYLALALRTLYVKAGNNFNKYFCSLLKSFMITKEETKEENIHKPILSGKICIFQI